MILDETKKREDIWFFVWLYGRFLTVSAITVPTMRTAIIMAIVEPRRYVSVIDVIGADVGAGVAGSCITVKPSSAVDGQ